MTSALCPGSFDPPTNGHIDVLKRCADVFDQVVVGVVKNPAKTSMFSAEDRVSMLTDSLAGIENIRIVSFEGLLVDFARSVGTDVLVKGLRALGDFDYELQMAQMNHRLADFDTLFIATDPNYGYVSSSLVKEVAKFGGSVESLVPPMVARALKERTSDG